ncbi:synphilin-1-like [Sinocyclocheilus anshuiensis]|uniref:synphilin-1-like n=1 Tax=Sinocyclocheilus anshuiensis TaxID=1608454 RepID=UPI0007B7BEBB|nr:PREDICTED: synphilin-1-like [Sinocyclocheilus anshuiensis]
MMKRRTDVMFLGFRKDVSVYEFDFTDDLPYKSIPELCRRHDAANDERQAPSINWARSAASGGAAIKPTGIADVYSKFRPVKRVSPLKHQPQESDPETEGQSKSRGLPLFGELEHYDLDMDEILDVPYIKSEKRSAAAKALKPDLRQPKPADQDRLRAQSAHGSELDALLSDKADGGPSASPLQPATGPRQDKPWRTLGEADEETKKTQNILNIVREGQISLLPHLAAENLERIRDEDGNNLLHVSAAQGHADCLQHLTSLMGEDCLNERNTQQLTPAGLAVRVPHTHTPQMGTRAGSMTLYQNQSHPKNHRSDTSAVFFFFLNQCRISMRIDLINTLLCYKQSTKYRQLHYKEKTLTHTHSSITCVLQERVLLWLLQFMQEQAISLDEADQNGNTAVHVAAQCGHLSCIQIETCMSLASQVVKLTKQLHEQTTARVALQNQLHLLLQTHELSSHVESWPEMMLTAEAAPDDGQWTLKQRHMDSVLSKPTDGEAEPGAGPGAGPMRRLGPGERRELKLAHLKQIMQRSLSESDAEESKPSRPERPTQLSIAEPDENKHKFSLTHRTPKSVDVCNPSPSSDHSDPETKPEELPDGQKVTTSPKSALKSPSTRRKTSQNLKLRVTFDEPPRKDGPAPDAKIQPSKRAFGTFRSIMETLSGNQNSNNNNAQSAAKHAGKKSESKSRSKTSAV